MHLSKTHLDEPSGVLVANVVNPTAGLLAGDRIECRVAVESGARLLLTTPSACRAHRMRSGFAELAQELRVAGGGFLECWPELFIPQARTRYRQRTAAHVEPGGELLFFESLAPGRVASGEAFEYEALDWETDIFCDGKLAARERYRLAPEERGVRALCAFSPTAYYASAFIVSPQLSEASPCWPAIHALHDPEAGAWVGCGALAGRGAWVVKLVAGGSVALRARLAAIRAALYAALDRPAPALRRATPVG